MRNVTGNIAGNIASNIARLSTRAARLGQRFIRNSGGASAVEFAIVAAPFFFVLMGVMQVGIFYMAQSALDTGVIKTAEVLRANFTAVPPGPQWSASTLKTNVSTNAGALINNDSSLKVEIRQLNSLTATAVPIVDGTTDYGSLSSTLVLRAQSTVITFTPGLGGLSQIYASAMVRRPTQ